MLLHTGHGHGEEQGADKTRKMDEGVVARLGVLSNSYLEWEWTNGRRGFGIDQSEKKSLKLF